MKQTVIITGANGDIGRSLASEFAHKGAQLAPDRLFSHCASCGTGDGSSRACRSHCFSQFMGAGCFARKYGRVLCIKRRFENARQNSRARIGFERKRLCPLAWISKERETKFENMPTAYGPVSLRWQLSQNGEVLRVNYTPKFHQQPEKILLHVPPVDGLKTISVNGKEYPAKDGTITLP